MAQHRGRHVRDEGRRGERKGAQQGGETVRLYGLHAAEAAIANPRRRIRAIYATANAVQRLALVAMPGRPPLHSVTPRDLDRMLGSDAVHQGILLEADPLPELDLADLAAARLVVVLDQVTDPHNVGAVLRSAAAFGAAGLVLPERHSPPFSGALAKAASGALDIVPVILIGTLAQSLGALGERGFLRAGLAEEASEPLETAALTLPLALVLGAEGKGLRQLTRETCDKTCRISTRDKLVSLNVSNAAAIALHWASSTAKRS
jgi:23S rRNA (guanosine2251-2'-O)-methyltransferase